MEWLLYKRPEFFEYESNRKFAPDLAKDGFYRWLDRYYLLLQIPLGIELYLLGDGRLSFMDCFSEPLYSGTALGLLTLLATSRAIAVMSQMTILKIFGGQRFLPMERVGTIIIMPIPMWQKRVGMVGN